jgi:hypothetical protein
MEVSLRLAGNFISIFRVDEETSKKQQEQEML